MNTAPASTSPAARENNLRRFAGLAVFAGHQEGIPELNIAGFDLWNLIRDITGHPKGSTVSTKTLDAHLA